MRDPLSPAAFINHSLTLRVTVLGDAVLDSYLEGSAGSICREAPVPNVTVASRTNVPGSAGNTAVNVGSLGSRTAFLSVTGDDLDAVLPRNALTDQGVSVEHVLTQPGRRTIVKYRVSARDGASFSPTVAST